MIARNNRCAVFIDQVSVFSSGLILRIEGRLHESEMDRQPITVEGGAHLALRPAVKVRYPDGRTAEVLDHAPPPTATPAGDSHRTEPTLSIRGTYVQGACLSFSCWLHPLPQHGDLSISVEWQALDLPLHQWQIREAAIRESLAKVSDVWDPN
ncbi:MULTISPECIES: hypothetical protein [Nonomuraea]|uniref:Uncharacterized protein n=1 Tax=Nonomuraea mangrovi TaxID=2316207 RepID=A0ABW4T8I4_9ACTN